MNIIFLYLYVLSDSTHAHDILQLELILPWHLKGQFIWYSQEGEPTCSWINIFVDPGITFQSTNQIWETGLQFMSILGLQPAFCPLLPIFSLWF